MGAVGEFNYNFDAIYEKYSRILYIRRYLPVLPTTRLETFTIFWRHKTIKISFCFFVGILASFSDFFKTSIILSINK